MVLLTNKEQPDTAVAKDTAVSNWKTVFLVLLVAAIMGGTAYKYSFALPGLLLPLLFIKRKDLAIYFGIGIILIIKIIFSLILEPSAEYEFYALDHFWILRESAAIFLFFAWMMMGKNILPVTRLTTMKWPVHAAALTILFCFTYSFSHRLAIGTDDNFVTTALFFFFVLIIGPYSKKTSFLAMCLLSAAIFIPMNSSFAILAGLIMWCIYLINNSKFAAKELPWRKAAIICVAFMMVMSLFAYLVNVRPVRETGEGNNGYTRATLAQAGYKQFASEPVIGSPLGRGILPDSVIREMGWQQYFDGSAGFNVYALSYHNSFIYLLTRFGFLSLIFFFFMFKEIPRAGPVKALLFMAILLLGAGSNVIIESLRSGPAFGLALGALFTLGNKLDKKREQSTCKTNVSQKLNKFVQR